MLAHSTNTYGKRIFQISSKGICIVVCHGGVFLLSREEKWRFKRQIRSPKEIANLIAHVYVETVMWLAVQVTEGCNRMLKIEQGLIQGKEIIDHELEMLSWLILPHTEDFVFYYYRPQLLIGLPLPTEQAQHWTKRTIFPDDFYQPLTVSR